MEFEKVSVKPNILAPMLAMQKELLEDYKVIEGLPEYPIDINDRKGQKAIRDFIGRFVEELSEAYEELVLAAKLIATNDIEGSREALRNYNIEMADAWAFLLEILIYSNVDHYQLDTMVKDWITNEHPQMGSFYVEGEPLKTFLNIGMFVNHESGRRSIINKPDRFIIASEQDMVVDPRLCGARRLSDKLLESHAECLWYLTNEVNKLRGFLKNKDWSMSEKLTNKAGYYNQFIMIFIAWGVYLDFAGFQEIAIFNNYNHKVKILRQRIKDKY